MDHQYMRIYQGLWRAPLISPGVILFFFARTLFATGAKKYIDCAAPFFLWQENYFFKQKLSLLEKRFVQKWDSISKRYFH